MRLRLDLLALPCLSALCPSQRDSELIINDASHRDYFFAAAIR